MIISLVNGILVTRWLISGLGDEYYGLWILLWSFFGYSLLLDFGFGVTAQKYTATEGWKKDIAAYNRTISTLFSFHGLMGVIIFTGTILASFFTMRLFHLSPDVPDKITFCKHCLLIFGTGTALIFPTGIFAEILIGLQKIYLRNYIAIASKIIEMFCVLLIFWLGGSIMAMICFNLAFSATTNLIMFFVVKKNIPGIRLRFIIDKEVFGQVFHFSCFVYLCSIARMLWARGSSILIGMLCGLADVGYFQVGGRFPGLMSDLATPYQENITPMVAALYAKGHHGILGRFVVNTMRWNSALVTIMTVGTFVYAPELLMFLLKVDTPQCISVCRVMALSIYFSLVFRSIPEKFLLMAEQHKLLSWTTLSESFVYIVLCAVLLNFYSIICVVYISFAIKAVTLVFVFGPVIWKYLRLGPINMLWKVSIQPAVAAGPMIAIGVLQKSIYPDMHPFISILIGSIPGGLLYVLLFFYFVLDKQERFFMIRKIRKSLPHK